MQHGRNESHHILVFGGDALNAVEFRHDTRDVRSCRFHPEAQDTCPRESSPKRSHGRPPQRLLRYEAVRFKEDGGKEVQLCLPCCAARYPDADLTGVSKEISTSPWYKLGMKAFAIKV